MADGKYGTKAGRLRAASALIKPGFNDPLILPLPTIRNPAEAAKVGGSMDREDFLRLIGAVAAIDRMLEYFQLDVRSPHAKACPDHKLYVDQVRDDLAFQKDMLREALLARPFSAEPQIVEAHSS